MFSLREPYVAPILRTRSSIVRGGGVRVGADVPLKTAPTLATKSDAADYMNVLMSLRNSFVGDVDKNIVVEDPATYHDLSEALLQKAGDLDGCYGLLSCDPFDDDSAPSPTDVRAYGAWSYRNKAAHQLARARYLENIWDRRGLTNAKLPLDLAFSKNWDDWDDRRRLLVNQIESWSAFDFGELQRLDLDLQVLRRRYTELTGLEPTMPWPSGIPKTTSLVDLAYAGLVIAGIGVVIYGLVHFFPAVPVAHVAAAA